MESLRDTSGMKSLTVNRASLPVGAMRAGIFTKVNLDVGAHQEELESRVVAECRFNMQRRIAKSQRIEQHVAEGAHCVHAEGSHAWS